MRSIVSFAAACLLLAGCASPDPTRVAIAAGALRGASEDSGVTRFLSIPYAAAPVGALRWRAPQPAPPWQGVRDATRFGPSCVQGLLPDGIGPWPPEFFPQGAVSEDCLTLSVWTPPGGDPEPAPVMVWIPGGGFTSGGEATAIYDGAALAQRGVIVVSINYRVGAFGLLMHPALESEDDGARGNYALRDVLAALGWVQANIAAFGGDPGRVTIAGQSAGGALVYALLDSPQARGLFSGAIIQSFPPGSHQFPDRAAAEGVAAAFAAALGADQADAMRAASADAVQRASSQVRFGLAMDDVLITNAAGGAAPYVNDVPVMIGITADEASFRRFDMAAHRDAVTQYGAGYAALYPATDDAQARAAALRRERERALVGLQRWARGRQSAQPLYLYLWTHAPPGPDAARYRAFHSAEVPYMFGALSAMPTRPFSETDHAIASRTLDYWANFVRQGDPNGEAARPWPNASQEPVFMELGERLAPAAPLPAPVTAFWNAYYDRTGAYVY